MQIHKILLIRNKIFNHKKIKIMILLIKKKIHKKKQKLINNFSINKK